MRRHLPLLILCTSTLRVSSFALVCRGKALGGVRGLAASASPASDALKVLVFLGSTRVDGPPRPARVGVRVAAFVERSLVARGHSVTIVDPVDLDLPLLRKPHFAYAQGKAPEVLETLAGLVASADCYVMVTPEYNHAASPALMNTLNHFGSSLFSFRPSAIVSYSMGQFGGVRAAANLRPFLSELGCLPVSAMVHVPHAHEALTPDGLPAPPPPEGQGASQDWEAYGARTWSQLEWWAVAAKNQKKVADPSEGSPAFSRDPSQRNSPQLATSGISLTSSSTSSTTGSDAQPSPTHPPPSETPIQPPPSPPKPTIRVGIVGTGTICEVVVTGLCLENAGDLVITISPRNAARAAALAAKFPDQVRIGKDNQDVVDSSDIVCIAVVPTLAEEVLAALEFRADHTVVGFMSTTRLDVIRKHAAPATKVLRAVPMPPFARRVGAIPMHPPDEAVAALFSRAGTTVEVATEDEVITLMSVTGMMAPFYASLSAAQKWAAKQGVEETASSRFVGALFHSLADNCKAQGNGFDHIVAESQTPGGLNEQALRELKASGVYTLLEAEMDVILARVQGKPRPEQIGPPREQ